MYAKFLRTHRVRAVLVIIKYKNATVTPTVRAERATHGICSEIFHTCLQRSIVSSDVGFCDGWDLYFLWVLFDYRVVQTFWWKLRKDCCFETGTINEVASMDVRCYLPIIGKEFVFWLCNSIFIFGFRQWNLYTVARSIKSIRKIGQFLNQKKSVLFWRYLLLFARYKAALSSNRITGTTPLQKFFGAFANCCFSMLGLRNVKNVLVKICIQVSSLLAFLRKMNKVYTNWDLALWQTSTILCL